ncbi:MAG: RHS repeat protein, partial [Sedimentisphaerales bacterium]|nr:RHS repeat protein [Sedimentisphaerales bacterium]
DRAGTLSYTYYADGNVNTISRTINGRSYATSWTYDNEGRISKIQYPFGEQIEYAYETFSARQGRPSNVSVTLNGTKKTVITSLNYKAFGPLRFGSYGNNLRMFKQHNNGYQLTSLYYGGGGIPIDSRTNFMYTSPSLIKKTYANDGAGNIDYIYDTLATLKHDLTFDANNRLTKRVEGSATKEVFAYDLTDNRIRNSSEYLLIDSQSNQLQGSRYGTSGSFSYLWQYDAAGNQTHKGGNTWTYGGDNRLRKFIKSNGQTYENWYDANNQRIAKKSGSVESHFIYDQNGKLLTETRNGSRYKSYIWLEGELIGLIHNGQLYYVHNDHLGRPEMVSDQNKAIVWKANNQSFN